MNIQCRIYLRSNILYSAFLLYFILHSTFLYCQQPAAGYLPPVTVFLDTCPPPKTIPAGKPEVIPLAVLKNKKGETIKPYPAIRKWLDGKIDSLPIAAATAASFILGEAGGYTHFQNYNTEHGLALSTVNSSCIDKFGNLWFSTQGGGVSRYDGKSFTTYTMAQGLANNVVSSILEDKMGNLWFGTDGGGVSRYNGKSFTTYTTVQGLANNIVWSILEDKTGNLWFGTAGGGVSLYDPAASNGAGGKFFTTYTTAQGLANNFVWSILEDKTGNLWFGTYGDGVSRYACPDKGGNSSFTTYTRAQGLANNVVRSILEDKTGNLWFGTNGGGVSRYNPENVTTSGKSFTTYTTAQGLADNYIRSILEDNSGNLWFGTEGGVSRYNPENDRAGGNSFTTYTTSQGLANNFVYSILEDKTGNLWFGTSGGGVSRYDGKSFTTYTTVQGLANNLIWSILEDKTGNLWFGTLGYGASRYDGKSFTTYTTAQGLPDNVVYSILEDKTGNLWFGTYGGGVSRYDGKYFTTYTTAQGLANNLVSIVLEDKTGNLWFGTQGGGVSRYDGKSFTTYTTVQGLANNVVSSILEDKLGNLWFGTSGGGVSRFDPSTAISIGGKSFTTYTTAQGLANNVVLSVMEDKTGNVWFGTQGGGVSRYDGKSFTTYTTVQGLPDNVVTSLISYEEKIIIGTNVGFGMFLNFTPNTALSGTEELSFLNVKNTIPTQNDFSNEMLKNYTPVIKIYNEKTGYPVKDVNAGHNTMYLDSKGIVWIATGDAKTALVRFDPTGVKYNTEPPVVVIQSVRINEENICWYAFKAPGSKLKAPSSKLKAQSSKLKAQSSKLKAQSSKLKAQSSKLKAENSKEEKDLHISAGDNLLNDSIVVAQQEMMTFGKILSREIREGIRKKFSGIQFDGITKFYPLPENLVLPYNHNHVTFEYNAIELARPYLVRYQYMLDGLDDTWGPLTQKIDVSYNNLWEGFYTFKLKAQYTGLSTAAGGDWSAPVIYTFRVLPPWYRTWWAYGIYFLLLFSVFLLLIWLNSRRLIKHAKNLKKKIEEATEVITKEKEKSDKLLLNILPKETAEELKENGFAKPRLYKYVTVMFTDYKGFTKMAEIFSETQLIDELNFCFIRYDRIIKKYNIEKIKTIGDSYMCVSGLPVPNEHHAKNMIMAAFEIQEFMRQYQEERKTAGKLYFSCRLGIHSGPVVAGVVGESKFAFDIWGDTVNVASRMESSGDPGKINISESTYQLVKDYFNCSSPREVEAKNKGIMKAYFVDSIKSTTDWH